MTGFVPGRVSIVVPAYKAAATIAETVGSCLAQTYADCEVIVVDDGSPDDVATVAAALGERVRVVRQANRGLAGARNRGFAEATGEFIAWMDADDLMQPRRIEAQVKVLRENPDVDLVSSDFSAFVSGETDTDPSHSAAYYRHVRAAGSLARLYDGSRSFEPPAGCPPMRLLVGHVYLKLLRGNFVHPPTVLVRRSACEAAGQFDEKLRQGGDYDYTVRLARRGAFACLAAPLLRYRRSATQMSSSAFGRMAMDCLAVFDKVALEDPHFARQHDGMLRERRAQVLLAAADLAASDGAGEAMRFLVRSFAYAPPGATAARIATKAVLPRPVINVLKRTLARPAAAANP